MSPATSEFIAKVVRGDVKEVTLYLSPNSYELQGEYKSPVNHKFLNLTVFKESAPDLAKQFARKTTRCDESGSAAGTGS